MEVYPTNILCFSIGLGLLWKVGIVRDLLKFALVEWVASIFLLQSEKWTHEHSLMKGKIFIFCLEFALLFFESVAPGVAYYITIAGTLYLAFSVTKMFLMPDERSQPVKTEKKSEMVKKNNVNVMYTNFVHVTPNRITIYRLEFLLLSYAERRQQDIERYLVGCKSLHSSYLERDTHGWIIPKPTLNSYLEIHEITGVSIDWSNKKFPTVKIYYMPSENGNGLLSISDIKCMLQLDGQEIQVLGFSLDSAIEKKMDMDERFCWRQETTMFQKVYKPYKLANTRIMETFFDADYIMKFFEIGSEVSANFPFSVRPVSHLLGHLSEELQHALRPINVREPNNECGCAHRFWIDVENINYQADCSEQVEYYYVNSTGVKLSIKTESLGPCPTRAGCKEFAKDMTTHYRELSQQVPVFARLIEISKLQFLLSKVHERLSDKCYKLSPADAEVPKTTNADFRQLNLVPGAHNQSFSISGGVDMAPTYNAFPFTPGVDDSVTYEHTRKHALAPLKYLDSSTQEGGIRFHARGEQQPSFFTDSTVRFFDVGTGLHTLDLAMFATIIKMQKQNK